MKKSAITLLNALGVFVALLLVWQGIAVVFHLPVYLLPTPLVVARSVVE